MALDIVFSTLGSTVDTCSRQSLIRSVEIPQVQFLDVVCRARFVQRHGSDRAKSVWREGGQHFLADFIYFWDFFGAPVSDTGAGGGAGITRESDSRVDPAHVN